MTEASRKQQPTPQISLSGRSIDDAIAAFDTFYAASQLHCRPATGPFWFKYVSIGDDELSMRRLRMDGYLRGDIATGRETIVQWITRGQARMDADDDEAPVQLGSAPTLFPAGRRFHIEYENVDQRLVHVNEDLLRDVAPDQRAGNISLIPHPGIAADEATTMQWRASVTKAVAAFRADGPTSAAWQEAKRDVARALLALYPLREEPSPAAPGSQIDAPLQAALDYLRNHAREQVTVADVAAAAGISIRTLQERFKRTLGRSPLTYLRDIRLDEVHAELQAPEPGMTTVAQVARYWGFGHLGRFSAEYTKRFGQYPRHTLRTR